MVFTANSHEILPLELGRLSPPRTIVEIFDGTKSATCRGSSHQTSPPLAIALIKSGRKSVKKTPIPTVDLISDVLPFGSLWYAGPSVIENANRIRKALQPIT